MRELSDIFASIVVGGVGAPALLATNFLDIPIPAEVALSFRVSSIKPT